MLVSFKLEAQEVISLSHISLSVLVYCVYIVCVHDSRRIFLQDITIALPKVAHVLLCWYIWQPVYLLLGFNYFLD